MGTELVDWMMQQSPCVHLRSQAVGMWQVLLEEGVLNHGKIKKISILIKIWAVCDINTSVVLFHEKERHHEPKRNATEQPDHSYMQHTDSII